MANANHPERLKKARLVSRLLNNPQLPVYIARMQSSSLVRLVEYLGKEDAQELLVYATPEQITAVVETDTWRKSCPGEEEKFSPGRFLEWLELWSEMGVTYVVRQLKELGTELFALTLNNYAVVVDIHEVGVSGWIDTFSRFGVMAKDDEQWPLVFQLITDVWSEDPEFMEEVLASCCLRRSLTVDKVFITENESLAPDTASNRDRNRQKQGFITVSNATAFLARIRSLSLEELCSEDSFDLMTVNHLKDQGRHFELAGKAMSELKSDSDDVAMRHDSHAEANSMQRELDVLLEPVLALESSAGLLRLSSAQSNTSLFLDQQIQNIRARKPDLAANYFSQLIYLANILMDAIALDARALTESEALNCAFRTCNLGLLYIRDRSEALGNNETVDSVLEHEPYLIRVFNIGYRLTSDIADRTYEALKDFMDSPKMQKKYSDDPWLQAAVYGFLNDASYIQHSRKQRSVNLNQLLDSLLAVCNPEVCEQLRILGDTCPRFPDSFDSDNVSTVYVNKGWRFVTDSDELERINNFLLSLPKLILR